MNCNITGNIEKQLKNLQGGVDKIYLFPYVKYSRSQIVLDDQFLQTFPSTTVFSVHSFTVNYSENTSVEGGDIAWDQNFSIELPRTQAGSEVYSFVKQDWRIIFVDRLQNIRILGLYNGLEAVVTNETGSDKTGFNGYKITFTGKEDSQALYLRDIEDVGFTIHNINNYVFVDGCNYAFMDGTNYILN